MFVRIYQQAVETVLHLAIPVLVLSVCSGICAAGESFYYSDMDGGASASCQNCDGGGCADGACEAGRCSRSGFRVASCGAAGCGAVGCGAAGCGGGCGPLSGLLAGRCGAAGCRVGCRLGGRCELCSGLLHQGSGIPSDGSHCGLPAPKYPVPFATPRPTTPTYLMYPPMSPHNSLPHYRSTYQFRHGPGLSRTQVHWRSKKLVNLADYIQHIFEIPR